MLQVNGNRTFTAVAGNETRRDGAPEAGNIARKPFYLDNVGTLIGERRHRRRTGNDAAQIHDAYAFERPGHDGEFA